jgi:hypothetical protein
MRKQNCVSSINDSAPISIKVNNVSVLTKSTINLLGVSTQSFNGALKLTNQSMKVIEP